MPTAPADCQRISSVYVITADGAGFFEFGWVVGHPNCDGFESNNYTSPHLFWATQTISSGKYVCQPFKDSIQQGVYATLRASDTDQNGRWGGWYNGTEMNPEGKSLDFGHGLNSAGMERAWSSDAGYARFNNLAEWHPSNQWTSWDNAGCFIDNDPAFDCRRIDAHTIVIEQ